MKKKKKFSKKRQYTPLRSAIHVDQLLSNVSVRYENKSYLFNQVFKEVPVKKDSDLFRVYDRNFRVPETSRANRGVAREAGFNVSTATYNLEKHALKGYISDDDADNYDLESLKVDETEALTDMIMRRQEKTFAALITTSSWSLNLSLTSTNAWDITTTTDIVQQYDTASGIVILNCGKKPNTTLMGRRAWNAAKNNGNVIDRTKYTSDEVGEALVARLLGMERLLIGDQVEDTADEGASTGANIVSLYNDAVWLGYVAPTVGPKTVTAGVTFRKSTPMVKTWRDEDRESDVVEVGYKAQQRVIASLAGFIIKDVY